jgi:pimeloyl-ACP methyl ester carboxylesterase
MISDALLAFGGIQRKPTGGQMLKVLFAMIVIGSATVAQAEDAWMKIPAPQPMPAATTSGLAKLNGISMYYASYGNAPGTPILMIHGGLAHADIWSAEVADLSKDHRVIVADTRGHGRSNNDGSEYTIELLAKDYIALLDNLGIEKVHLVGWSDGANIGYQISLLAPERLASHFAHAGNVTLAGVNPAVDGNAVFASYITMMKEDYTKMSPTPDQWDAFLTGISKMWYADKPNGIEALSVVKVPTLVVQGQYDEAILAEHSAAIAASIPGGRLMTMPNVSHFASLQDPTAYTAAIRAWLSEQKT